MQNETCAQAAELQSYADADDDDADDAVTTAAIEHELTACM